jgi:putative lysine transport system permease protein
MQYFTLTGFKFIDVCLSIVARYWPSLLLGIRTTLIISLSGTVIGLLIGLVVGGLRAIRVEETATSATKALKRGYDLISKAYIEIFRGTPMMVQGVFIYYFLRPALQWTPVVAGIFVISVNTGSYMAEIVRAGIQSVDRGQTEAARSLGMSSLQTMIHVVLPQGIKNAFPAMGNEFIVNIKDSSVLNAISVTELYFQSNSIAGSLFKFRETFFVTACVYLILTSVTSWLLHVIELRINHTKTSYPASQTTADAMAMTGKGD